MLLTLTTTHCPATELGFLLRKNPARLQSFSLSFGKAHVFYPEATPERCSVALLVVQSWTTTSTIGWAMTRWKNFCATAKAGWRRIPSAKPSRAATSNTNAVWWMTRLPSWWTRANPTPMPPPKLTLWKKEAVERSISLNEQRLGSALAALKASGAARVLDLGCGDRLADADGGV